MPQFNLQFGNRDQRGSRTGQSGQSTQLLDCHQHQKWKPKSFGKCFTTRKPNQNQTSFDELLERISLRRTLRAGAWIKRFIHNCKLKEKKLGSLLTEEILDVRSWIKRGQRRDRGTTGYSQISRQLNMKPSAEGVMTCHGRIQGQTPIYLPNRERFTGKLVQLVHSETLHEGVTLRMVAVRER